MDHELHLTLTA